MGRAPKEARTKELWVTNKPVSKISLGVDGKICFMNVIFSLPASPLYAFLLYQKAKQIGKKNEQMGKQT